MCHVSMFGMEKVSENENDLCFEGFPPWRLCRSSPKKARVQSLTFKNKDVHPELQNGRYICVKFGLKDLIYVKNLTFCNTAYTTRVCYDMCETREQSPTLLTP